MKNQFKVEFVAMIIFVMMFSLSIQIANMFFLSVAMFALSVAFKRIANNLGFVFFICGFGFLFASIVSPVFNAMTQTTYSHFQVNSFF